ncbi:MAG: hypothetical protein ACPGXZ_10770 [Saprospiraceae bacterium]
MNPPPEFITSLLHSIESVVVELYKEFPTLTDKDVEMVFDKLGNYYKAVKLNKKPAEPSSNRERIFALIEEILNILDLRQEAGLDASVLEDEYICRDYNIGSLEDIYMKAFKILTKSARFWRKKDGKQGYLNYITEFV